MYTITITVKKDVEISKKEVTLYLTDQEFEKFVEAVGHVQRLQLVGSPK